MGRRVRQVVHTVRTRAPVPRVWLALTDPDEVTAWDGVIPLHVPAGYPAVGQHARWWTSFGPLRLVLHDRVVAVEPLRRLGASLDIGFVHVGEEYRLAEVDGGTELVSDNVVSSRLAGLGWVAERVVRAGVAQSMSRLVARCEEGLPPDAR